MANKKKMHQQRELEERQERYAKILLLLIQIRIYIGIMIFSVLLINSLSTDSFNVLYLIYLAMHIPYIVSLTLLYKKKKLFRIFYLAGAMLFITFTIFSGASATALLAPEVIIIFLLFRLQHIEDKFS